jgi:hypothetical protein
LGLIGGLLDPADFFGGRKLLQNASLQHYLTLVPFFRKAWIYLEETGFVKHPLVSGRRRVGS